MKALRTERTRRPLLVGARKGLADSGFFGQPVRNKTAFIFIGGWAALALGAILISGTWLMTRPHA